MTDYEIDIAAVKNILEKSDSPVYESTLIRSAFPGTTSFNTEPLEMFQKHFILMHNLYRLQNDYMLDNKYLHVHFMRIHLAEYPKIGLCWFYDEHYSKFCSEKSEEGMPYCCFHASLYEDASLEILSEKYFYLDKENYHRLNKETAESFINGTWELFYRYEEYLESLKILGLHKNTDKNTVKKKFRNLVKSLHPDSGGDEKEFIKINNAYKTIINCLGKFEL